MTVNGQSRNLSALCENASYEGLIQTFPAHKVWRKLMFSPVQIPFESVMLFNVVSLKHGVDFDHVEMALAEMCSVVKENYGNEEGGFIAGQVFKYAGFIGWGEQYGTVSKFISSFGMTNNLAG